MQPPSLSTREYFPCFPKEILDILSITSHSPQISRPKVKVKVTLVRSDSFRLYSPWNSPGQNTGVGSLSLLQEIFPMQGSNPGLPHCRQILYQLSHQGSLGILEWVTYPFSSGSSQPRNRTGVSYIVGRFFASWATKES